MFFGPYGASEDGTYSEWVAVRKEDLCLIPDNVDDVSGAGIPVAYLTAQVALARAGFFQAGKTVRAPAIGGSIGNAVTQLARALGAKHAISSTTNQVRKPNSRRRHSALMKSLIPSLEKLADGVRRITGGYKCDIVIDGVGGEVLSEALASGLRSKEASQTLGYSASRMTTINVTHLIVPQASIRESQYVRSAEGGRCRRLEDHRLFVAIRGDPNRSWLRLSRWPKRLMHGCVTLSKVGRLAESSSKI